MCKFLKWVDFSKSMFHWVFSIFYYVWLTWPDQLAAIVSDNFVAAHAWSLQVVDIWVLECQSLKLFENLVNVACWLSRVSCRISRHRVRWASSTAHWCTGRKTRHTRRRLLIVGVFLLLLLLRCLLIHAHLKAVCNHASCRLRLLVLQNGARGSVIKHLLLLLLLLLSAIYYIVVVSWRHLISD